MRGIGLRRNVFGGVDDFRLAVDGATASFRRAAAGEGGPADNNCVLADSDTTIQAIADMLGGYTVSAPAAPNRPALGANGAMSGDGSDRLDGTGTGLAASISAAGMVTIYAVSRTQSAGSLFMVSDGGSFTDSIAELLSASNRRFDSRSTAGALPSGDVLTAFGGYTLPQSVPDIVTLQTANGDNCRAWVNGTLSATGGVQNELPSALDLVRLFNYSGYFTGDAYELFFCLAVHDNATVASVTASLQAYWEGRGVTF